MENYTVEKITGNYDISEEMEKFFHDFGMSHYKNLNLRYDVRNLTVENYIKVGHVWFCFRNNKPVGFMLATMGPVSLDLNYIALRQTFLYALPGTRGAHHLLKEFVDFGKRHANDVIITVGKYTNLKSRSLERLGFGEWETIYKLEV